MIDPGELVILLVTLQIYSNIESTFVTMYLPKYELILLGILNRPFNKSDFVKHINNVFTETWVLDKQECYLSGDLNINLLHNKKEIFSKKSYRTNNQNLLPLTKGHLDFCFSFSLEQLISIPPTVTSKVVCYPHRSCLN